MKKMIVDALQKQGVYIDGGNVSVDNDRLIPIVVMGMGLINLAAKGIAWAIHALH